MHCASYTTSNVASRQHVTQRTSRLLLHSSFLTVLVNFNVIIVMYCCYHKTCGLSPKTRFVILLYSLCHSHHWPELPNMVVYAASTPLARQTGFSTPSFKRTLLFLWNRRRVFFHIRETKGKTGREREKKNEDEKLYPHRGGGRDDS